MEYKEKQDAKPEVTGQHFTRACTGLNYKVTVSLELPKRNIAGELDLDISKRAFTKRLTTNDANFKLILLTHTHELNLFSFLNS